MIDKADIEYFDEMSNKDKYYLLNKAYRLLEYLSTKHSINETRLETTLETIRILGTMYGYEAQCEVLDEENEC